MAEPGGQSLAEWLTELRTWDAARPDAPTPATLAYGDHPDQVADLWLPPEDALPDDGVPPLVVSIHGGYFMAPYRRDLHAPIVHELVLRGFAVWNVEYRRTGTGGGLQETTEDVWAAVDALPPTAGQVAVFGHSAGGLPRRDAGRAPPRRPRRPARRRARSRRRRPRRLGRRRGGRVAGGGPR